MDNASLLEVLLPYLGTAAITFCVVGISWRVMKMIRWYQRLPTEHTDRAPSKFNYDRKTLFEALWAVNVIPYINWFRGNPITFLGHVLYHGGLFLALGIYGIVGLVIFWSGIGEGFWNKVFLTCEWFSIKETIFEATFLGNLFYWTFFAALIMACSGMTTPFVMSFLKMRGMIRPTDAFKARAGITRTVGMPSRLSEKGYERKIIGLGVLVMDWAMLLTFIFPSIGSTGAVIHVTFALCLVSLLPFSFLLHEVNRVPMLLAVRRVMDGRS